MRDDGLIEMEPCAHCDGSRPCLCYCGRKYKMLDGRGKPVRRDKCHMCLSSPFSVAGSLYCGCGRADTFGIQAPPSLHASPQPSPSHHEEDYNGRITRRGYQPDQAGIMDFFVAQYYRACLDHGKKHWVKY